MPSNRLLALKDLKEALRKLLKKYNGLEDIIIFGSYLKEKFMPEDIDIALVMETKDYDLANKVNADILGVNAHITIVLLKEFYLQPESIWKSLVAEGFSIKKNNFIRDIIKIKPVAIFSFKINKMNATEKMQFNRGFRIVAEETNSLKIGAGCVIAPEDKSGRFNDFFETWSGKAEKKILRALMM